MKKLLILLSIIFLFSCGKKEKETEIKIISNGTDKVVSVAWGDSLLTDTVFTEPISVSDIVILNDIQRIEDSLLYEKLKADSLYFEFQQDSVNLRLITRRINGGYNGWDQRYTLWLNAREVIKQHNDTVK